MSEENKEEQVEQKVESLSRDHDNEVIGAQILNKPGVEEPEAKEEQQKEEPKKEEPAKADPTPTDPSDMTDDQIDQSDAPDSLKTALKRANRRLRKERQSKAQLEDRLGELESRFQQVDSQKEADSLLKEIEGDLNLDADNTKKFYSAVDRIVEKRLKNVPKDQHVPEGLTPKQAEFAKKSSQAMQQYPDEERGRISQIAQQELLKDMTELQKLGLNTEEALDEPPTTYILRAVRRMAAEDAQKSRNEELNKNNQQNLASSESSKNGVGRSTDSSVITNDVFQKNRNNPEWVRKNRAAILEAANNGVIRR